MGIWNEKVLRVACSKAKAPSMVGFFYLFISFLFFFVFFFSPRLNSGTSVGWSVCPDSFKPGHREGLAAVINALSCRHGGGCLSALSPPWYFTNVTRQQRDWWWSLCCSQRVKSMLQPASVSMTAVVCIWAVVHIVTVCTSDNCFMLNQNLWHSESPLPADNKKKKKQRSQSRAHILLSLRRLFLTEELDTGRIMTLNANRLTVFPSSPSTNTKSKGHSLGFPCRVFTPMLICLSTCV